MTGRLDVIHADTHMSKPLAWIGVAVGDLEVRIVLGAVVVSQLDEALAIRPVGSCRCALLVIVGEEVEGEFVFGEVEFVDLFHAEELVELD